MKRLYLTLAVVLCLLFPGGAEAAPLRVFVSVPPQAYFVERIGADLVKVQSVLPKGADHDTYEPTPRQMIELANASLYVGIGVPQFVLESRHVYPYLKKRGIPLAEMSGGITVLNDDPHIWLSPAVVRAAAENIFGALSKADPAHAGAFRRNLDDFVSEINALDKRISERLKDRKGEYFIIFHPSLGYFASRYGLNQVAIEAEGKSPSASHIRRVIDLAKNKKIRTILVQQGFETKSAGAIAREIGAGLADIDPLEKDWPRAMWNITVTLDGALKK